jgi:hypothetical protein
MHPYPLGDPKLNRTPFHWPAQPNLQTQIQQIKGASQPTNLGSLATVQSANMPKAVIGVRTTVRLNGNQRMVTVSFARNPDPFFQKVNVYLAQGAQPPILITSSPTSPITFSTPKNGASSTIFVQSEGNWGPIPLAQSPSASLRLS